LDLDPGFTEPTDAAFGRESLAARLGKGHLRLGYALRCAADIAATLREFQEDGRVHGSIGAASILLHPSGAVLAPPDVRAAETQARGDIAAFGAVLYQMLLGDGGAGGGWFPEEAQGAGRNSPDELRSAAARLALRCLAAPPQREPAIQSVLTEVRVLGVLARQCEAQARNAEAPHTRDRCPKCGGGLIRDTKPRSAFERFLDRLQIPIRRCRRCDHRYVAMTGGPWVKETPD
jgi:hypothetical protein